VRVAVVGGLADTGDRPPVVVVVLVVPGDHRGVGHRHAEQREQASARKQRRARARRRGSARSRSSARAGCGAARTVVPEVGDLGLVGGAVRAALAPEATHLAKGRRVLRAARRRRRRRTQLGAAGESPRRHRRPVGQQAAGKARRCGDPPAGAGGVVVIDGVRRTVGAAQRQDGVSALHAEVDAGVFSRTVRDGLEARCQRSVEGGLLRGVDGAQHPMRRRGGGGLARGAGGGLPGGVVGGERTVHAVDRLENRHVGQRHDARGAWRRRAVGAHRVQENLVPVQHHGCAESRGSEGREQQPAGENEGTSTHVATSKGSPGLPGVR
jgi:hypothetical protein